MKKKLYFSLTSNCGTYVNVIMSAKELGDFLHAENNETAIDEDEAIENQYTVRPVFMTQKEYNKLQVEDN